MGNLERDPALFQMEEGDLVKMADSLRPASRMVALREDTSEPRLCGNCAGTPSKRRRSLPRGRLGDARVSGAFIGRRRISDGASRGSSPREMSVTAYPSHH